jgi:hypothetical protein
LQAFLFKDRCYNEKLCRQISEALLASEETIIISTKPEQIASVSVKAKPSTPTMTNRVSAPNEANSKKEYEDLVVTAQ